MKKEQQFAVWITGIPSSGKSTITRELVSRLKDQGVYPAVLESDVLRAILTPEPTYFPDERDRFYLQMARLGALLTHQGIPVIFDATANRRTYRDHARSLISPFVEVFVQCPFEVCRARDTKGIFAAAERGDATNVPGVQAIYEPPLGPEVTIDCRETPSVSAEAIVAHLKVRHYL